MAYITAANDAFSVKAYQGDAKTLLAWNFPAKKAPENLAGFTVQCAPPGVEGFFLPNSLQFETPGSHAQVATEPATSSINAPIHKFRWLHVPGSLHQGIQPVFGKYTYTVTPRFFDDSQSLEPIDSAQAVAVKVDVKPFTKNGLSLGFTRGFTQSQAFVRHFGLKGLIRPKEAGLLYDTSQVSGKNSAGDEYTFKDEYGWLGFTARERIFAILDQVVADKSLRLDVFAYDLNEPDLIAMLLRLAEQGRIRIILDNATLHHDADLSKPEDEFEKLFKTAEKKATKKGDKKPSNIVRGKFGRFAHDKILIVSDKSGPKTVLTGSTNFSVTGLYVNSNHVLVFDDRVVAAKYAELFQEALEDGVAADAFRKSALATQVFTLSSKTTPPTEVTFSPHAETFAQTVLDNIATRVTQEGKESSATGSVLFAVMEIGTGTGPVFPTLTKLHANGKIFSYGISDTTSGISLYRPGVKKGVLVTGKPTKAQLPPPFDQVPGVGLGHQVHHKFVVCGFNGKDPVVFCGSSNLALMGEQVNGDNLLTIRDGDVATVFALEALALVDHFDFLDRVASKKKVKKAKPKFASKQQEAASAGWFLSTTGKWAEPYFDPKDLRFVDRQLFG